VVFSRDKPESYWDEFLVDIFFYALPVLSVIGAVLGGIATENYKLWLAIGIMAFGTSGLVRVRFRYTGKMFPYTNVSSLLRMVKVSALRPIPVTLRGRIIGRGVPGLIWSEDFVVQDNTGILFLDYQQPLAVWEGFFGLFKAREYTGRDVEVTGWYRRSPVPYVELKTITSGGISRRCYTLYGKVATSVVVMVVGAIVLFAVLGQP
jgi:heat shock protein HtpX